MGTVVLESMRLPPFHAVLNDGSCVYVRQMTPDDRALLRAGFDGLSARSRQSRFLAAHGQLSESEVEKFSGPSTPAHYAIGVLADGVPVATARFIRETEASAELAITVIDAWQHRGLGPLLLHTLMGAARLHGYDRLTAFLRTDNHGMRQMLSAAGARLTASDQSELTFTLPLAPQSTPVASQRTPHLPATAAFPP